MERILYETDFLNKGGYLIKRLLCKDGTFVIGEANLWKGCFLGRLLYEEATFR